MSYNIYKKVRYIKLSKKYLKSVIEVALKVLGRENTDISVHLIGDKRMKKINNNYRGIDKTTDVIAFAMQEGKVFDKVDFGDIFICINQIVRQAKKKSIPYIEEFTRVLIHGILHLCGHDHAAKKQEEKMFGLQEKILKKVIFL